MSKVDKKTDERELKASYKEVIKQYLPERWQEYKIDEFVEALFRGIYVPLIPNRYTSSDSVRAIFQTRQKWLFSTIPVRNESGTMIVGYKYFPNPRATKTKKKTIEKPQEEHKNV